MKRGEVRGLYILYLLLKKRVPLLLILGPTPWIMSQTLSSWLCTVVKIDDIIIKIMIRSSEDHQQELRSVMRWDSLTRKIICLHFDNIKINFVRWLTYFGYQVSGLVNVPCFPRSSRSVSGKRCNKIHNGRHVQQKVNWVRKWRESRRLEMCLIRKKGFTLIFFVRTILNTF